MTHVIIIMLKASHSANQLKEQDAQQTKNNSEKSFFETLESYGNISKMDNLIGLVQLMNEAAERGVPSETIMGAFPLLHAAIVYHHSSVN